MKLNFIGIVFLYFLSSNILALPVVINGKSAAGDAFVFRLYTISDPISGQEKMVDQQRPDNNGNFLLGFDASEIQRISIKVGLQSLSMFVQPGKSYELDFNEITIKDQNVFLPQSPLRVVFGEEDMLNLVLDGFEYSYQRFLQQQFIELIKYRDRRIYDLFEKSVYEKLADTPIHDSVQRLFFKNYVEYRLADLRLAARLDNRDSLGIKMIHQRPIQLRNPAYSQFLLKFFDKYFLEYRGGKNNSLVKKSINESSDYFELLDLMGEDIVLQREQIRELIFIYALKQSYYLKQISKDHINEMLIHLSHKSKFELNRSVSQNVYHSLTTFLKGHPIPYFSLKNKDGQQRTNKDYLGKKLYLMFVSSDCETCEADIRILKSILGEFESSLDIVTVFTGFDSEEASNWMNEQQIKWDALWFKDDFALLNEFKVKTFPKYLLIDEKGNLLSYFPPKPRENFRAYFKNLQEKEKGVEREASDFFRKN